MTSSTKVSDVARGSETKQGEGWWMASDRLWYGPELHPSYVKPAEAPGAADAAALAAAEVQIQQATPTPQTEPLVAQSVVAQPAVGQPTQSNFQTPPGAPTMAPAHASSGATGETPVVDEDKPERPNFVAGVVVSVGAVLSILGTLLAWATSTGDAIAGVDVIDIRLNGFDSSGRSVVFFAVLMLVLGALLIRGIRPGWIFGAAAAGCGAIIIALVLYSYFDITGKASKNWARAVAIETQTDLSIIQQAQIGLKSGLGLWLTALGGLLGTLTPPFLRRDPAKENDA